MRARLKVDWWVKKCLTCCAKTPAASETGSGGHRVQQRVGQVCDRQVDDERAGGAAQSFESATPRSKMERINFGAYKFHFYNITSPHIKSTLLIIFFSLKTFKHFYILFFAKYLLF